MRHGIQVIHSQPPGVRLLHSLSLFTVRLLKFLVSIYSLASQTHALSQKREGSGELRIP